MWQITILDRRIPLCNGLPRYLLVAALYLGMASAASAVTYYNLNMSNIVNSDLTTYTDGAAYPSPGSVTIGGIPFTLTSGSNGHTWVVGGLATSAATYSVTNQSVPTATTMYVIINSAYGTCGDTTGSIKVSTASASVTYSLVEGQNARDHYNGSFCNTETQSIATVNYTGGVRFDVYQFNISTLTNNGATAVTGFSFTNNGYGGSQGSPLIAAVTFQQAAPTPLALWHLDETSWSGVSGEVVDSGGSGYNGISVGGATTAGTSPAIAGSPGTCYYGSFNGSTTYVQLPTSLGHLGSTFTITAWIRPTSISPGRVFWDDYNYNGIDLGFDDWGDSKMHFYIRSPSGLDVHSGITLSTNQWYFVAISFDVLTDQTMTILTYNSSGTLLDSQSTAVTSFNPSTGPYSTIGGNATGSVEGAINRFPGNIDEVIVYNSALTTAQITSLALATHPCADTIPNHYAVSSSSSAVNCSPTPVTITAHTSAHAALATTDAITLGTSSAHGDWTLTTGNGTFTAGASNSGAASYAYSATDNGTAVFALRDTYPETVTINVTDGSITAKSGTATSSEDSPITFAPSGFRITNGSNVATTIGTQQSGVTSTQSLALQAIRTDTATGACTAAFASGTTVNVGLALQCNNPTSCIAGQTLSLASNGTTTSLISNANSGLTSYTTVPLKFTTANGEAPFTLTYTDAGQITLAARYNIPLGGGGASANNMVGSAQFVVQPYTLKLSNIKATTSGTTNPAATSASGSVFEGAGQSFTATVTATNYQGAATPNFGQETTTATVALTPALVLPASGHNPAVSGTFASYSSGSSTGTGFSWSEVGIITLTPSIASYLGSGPVTGTTSGNVGRFVPNNFATAVNTPVFGTACGSGEFTYVGQPFTYTTPPMITATAQALSGTTTQNYTGAFMRLSNSSLTGRTYTPTPSSPSLTLTGLPATSVDPTIADLGTGSVTLTYSAGSGIAFTRGNASAPFSANIALSQNVIDQDGVTASNPVTFNGLGSGILWSTSTNQFYGRLTLRNALGSELLDLPMQLTTQYYLSSTQGFITNTGDNCTAAPTLAFSAYQQNLEVGMTCVRDSGSPGASGLGCSAPASSRYSATAQSGNFNLILAAPGTGNNGALTVTPSTPSYLQYLWSASSGSNSNPSGMAAFGLFPGSPSRVYQREVY
jgi:MSHA biogenesis protein MshQ